MRFSALELAALSCSLLLPVGCGSRSELALADQLGPNAGTGGSPPVVACKIDSECPAPNACGSYRCQSQRCEFVPISCDDDYPCTEDTCDPKTGCDHRALSLDMDGDKHNSPRPGFAPGTDICGDDCDDTNPNVFPKNKEVCDGVDNDCDGVVDNGFAYQRSPGNPVPVSPPSAKRAQRDDGGITATSSAFVVTYTSLEDRAHSHLQGLSSSRARLFDTEVSEVNSNTYGGALSWSGQGLATVWSDAHTAGEYDLYSRLFTATGDKRNAPVRLTQASSYSLHPSLKWNQAEYVVAFDDRRGLGSLDMGPPRIFGQRMAPDGSLLGSNVLLAGENATNEYPALALSQTKLGLAYQLTESEQGPSRLGFRVLDAMLNVVGTSSPIGDNVGTPALAFVKDRFIALWDVSDGATQGDSIWAMSFDPFTGAPLLGTPRKLVSARFARSVAAMSLGDRFLMMWADDAQTTPGLYQLYFEVLGPEFDVKSPRQRFTFSNANALMPGLVAGPEGKIGVVFEGWQDGTHQVYFDTLECAATP